MGLGEHPKLMLPKQTNGDFLVRHSETVEGERGGALFPLSCS